MQLGVHLVLQRCQLAVLLQNRLAQEAVLGLQSCDLAAKADLMTHARPRGDADGTRRQACGHLLRKRMTKYLQPEVRLTLRVGWQHPDDLVRQQRIAVDVHLAAAVCRSALLEILNRCP